MKLNAPRARTDLEFIPIRQSNQMVVVVRDQLGLVREGTALPSELFELMSLLDGSHTLRDLQMFMMRKKGGMLVGIDEVQAIIDQLDQYCLLESEKFIESRDKIVSEFVSSTLRPCSHCGTWYPANKGELEQRVEQILSQASVDAHPKGDSVIALVAPHIDLNVGTKGYANAYTWLGSLDASRVIVLGVGHQMREGLFCLTAKDFETPLGLIRTDKDAVSELQGTVQQGLTPDDFPHRSEHSIEFQALFLKYLSKGEEFRIVPILCGSLWTGSSAYNRAIFVEKAGPFLERLQEMLQDKDNPTIIVAGIDLSHIGPKFGHDAPAAYLKGPAQAHDHALLDAALALDPEAFWEESTRVKDRYNVCGFTVLACLLEVLPESKGQLLHYEMWFEPPTQSAVSFCAAGFTRV